MTQTPTPPAGWYPQGHQERWWDGTAWSDNFRPLGSEQTQPYVGPPVRQSHTARNILIVLAVMFLLFVGGCFATLAVVGHRVNEAVNDNSPGGPNNPLTVTEGRAFEVNGFEYADGWTISQDPVDGTMTVDNLVVTNHRGKADRLDVEIELSNADAVVATAFCTVGDALNKIPEDATATVVCTSTDPLPGAYDQVTIQDVF